MGSVWKEETIELCVRSKRSAMNMKNATRTHTLVINNTSLATLRTSLAPSSSRRVRHMLSCNHVLSTPHRIHSTTAVTECGRCWTRAHPRIQPHAIKNVPAGTEAGQWRACTEMRVGGRRSQQLAGMGGRRRCGAGKWMLNGR